MKIVYGLDGDPTIPVTLTTSLNEQEMAGELKTVVGVGNPYYAFNEIPDTVEANIAWNPAGAPNCAGNANENEQAMAAMLGDAALQTLPNEKVFAAA